MNYKNHNTIVNIKLKIDDTTIKVLRIVLYPIIKLNEIYEKSELKRKILIRKYTKEILRRVYYDVRKHKYSHLTDSYNPYNYGYDWMRGNSEYSGLRYAKGTSDAETLDYIINILEKDKSLIVEEIKFSDFVKPYDLRYFEGERLFEITAR